MAQRDEHLYRGFCEALDEFNHQHPECDWLPEPRYLGWEESPSGGVVALIDLGGGPAKAVAVSTYQQARELGFGLRQVAKEVEDLEARREALHDEIDGLHDEINALLRKDEDLKKLIVELGAKPDWYCH